MSTGAAPVFMISTKSATIGSSDSTSLMTIAAEALAAVAARAPATASEATRPRRAKVRSERFALGSGAVVFMA